MTTLIFSERLIDQLCLYGVLTVLSAYYDRTISLLFLAIFVLLVLNIPVQVENVLDHLPDLVRMEERAYGEWYKTNPISIPFEVHRKHDVFDHSECGFDWEPFNGNEVILLCGHKFHSQCLRKWEKIQFALAWYADPYAVWLRLPSYKCPLCRQKYHWTLKWQYVEEDKGSFDCYPMTETDSKSLRVRQMKHQVFSTSSHFKYVCTYFLCFSATFIRINALALTAESVRGRTAW